jgi:hypothetical protein
MRTGKNGAAWYTIDEVLARHESWPPAQIFNLAEILLSQQGAYACCRLVREDGTISAKYELIHPDVFLGARFSRSAGELWDRQSNEIVAISVYLSELDIPEALQLHRTSGGRPAPLPSGPLPPSISSTRQRGNKPKDDEKEIVRGIELLSDPPNYSAAARAVFDEYLAAGRLTASMRETCTRRWRQKIREKHQQNQA